MTNETAVLQAQVIALQSAHASLVEELGNAYGANLAHQATIKALQGFLGRKLAYLEELEAEVRFLRAATPYGSA